MGEILYLTEVWMKNKTVLIRRFKTVEEVNVYLKNNRNEKWDSFEAYKFDKDDLNVPKNELAPVDKIAIAMFKGLKMLQLKYEDVARIDEILARYNQ